MEEALDEIASGERNRLQYLKSFYLGPKGLRKRVDEREDTIKPDVSRTVQLEQVGNGTKVRVGRFGAYLVHNEKQSEEIRATIPEEIAPADLTQDDINEIIEIQKKGPVPIGTHPDTGENIYCLIGRYGPYVQLGEQTDDNEKPKRAGVPKGMRPKDVTLELAVKLLSLPRTLGVHPETGKEVVAGVGRFGPFVVHDGDFRSLKKDDDVYTVGLDRALELLAQEKKTRRNSKVVKDLGTDAQNNNRKVSVYDGKYGFYIKYGSKNIRLPEEKKNKEAIEKMSLEEALEIVRSSKKK
jgi:DNA topoisomerase-1